MVTEGPIEKEDLESRHRRGRDHHASQLPGCAAEMLAKTSMAGAAFYYGGFKLP